MFLSQFTLQSTYPVGPHDCWETVSFKGLSFTYCIAVLHFSDIRCQLPPWLLLGEHNGMQFVGLDDEASLWDDSDMVSLECKVSKQQQRLFKLNSHFPKNCCHLSVFSYTCWENMYIYFELFLKQTPVVYSSVYFCMAALITVFHRWCSQVIKSGWIQTALVEPSHQTDRINSCCQHLANTQLTFFVREFSSSQTEGTLHCSLITFERLFLRSGFTWPWPFSFIRCYEADRKRISPICVVFISFSGFHLLQLLYFFQFPRAYSICAGERSLSCLGLASRPVARLCCISNRLRLGR